MSSLQVNPLRLEAIVLGLGGLGYKMEEMHTMPPSSAAALGGVEVERGLEDFCSHWAPGVEMLGKSVHRLADNLQQAIKNYERTDACIAGSARH